MNKRLVIPKDTNGFPLPPPCPADSFCTIPSYAWRDWWKKHLTGKADPQFNCCVCAQWLDAKHIMPLKRAGINKKIQDRFLNSTLNEIYICKSCRRACSKCRQSITNQQKQEYEVCETCYVPPKKTGKPARR